MSTYDRQLTIFSPEGRLFQLEYAFKAINTDGLTSIGIRGENAAVIAIPKRLPDKLVDASSVTRIFQICKGIGCVATGILADIHSQIQRAISECHSFHYKNGYEMPCDLLAKRMADLNQVPTQKAGMRLLAVAMIFISFDDEKGPMLYKVDPSGHVVGMRAATAGVKSVEVGNALEKKMKDCRLESNDELVKVAIATLCNVLGSDMTSEELEVGFVSKEGERRFCFLGKERIDEFLNQIAEAE